MLSDKVKKEIEGLLSKYPTKRSAVMDAMKGAQGDDGYITEEAMREIADLLGLEPIEVQEMVGFYTMYNRAPVGKYHVQVCRNISCSLLGVEHIIEHIEGKLGIKAGETTGDKLFTLSLAECLGSCGTAPMMQVNEDYYEELTPEKVDEILDGMK